MSRCYRCRSFVSFLLANAPTLHSTIHGTFVAHRPLWGFRCPARRGASAQHCRSVRDPSPLRDSRSPGSQPVGNVGDGWFAATEKSDYIQAIGLSSAKFQQFPPFEDMHMLHGTHGLFRSMDRILHPWMKYLFMEIGTSSWSYFTRLMDK